ncbi:gamma-glutamyltransferase family protein [Microlunatus parietis]|uniref:Gamma-glutamyltranspeptidase/glutathione hydrolase n=1 Tax=Microlunatus parietis TaxID=682979 RepID=A0A7Y9LFY0_9ACTN|nr:gamma-glutamyltransferase family protein [Microlunatus parietis]NYE74566.1 gamma-glutamyltranspeptidase/glutathione hydrolase [Microlunatus parietis]
MKRSRPPVHDQLRIAEETSMMTTRPELIGDFGMVASTHWLASAAGMSVLERGGNAADAAVAAGFVLQIVEPHLNGPGGEVPILVWSESERNLKVISGQGVAPEAATIETITGLGLELMPGTGLLPATVPGSFGAWLRLLRQWGTWSVADILEPAITLARKGSPVLSRVEATVAGVADLFRTEWPSSAEVWLPGDAPPAAGSRFRNPALADTYARIARESEQAGGTRDQRIQAAHDAWYAGFVAEAIDAFCRTAEVLDTSGERHRGLLTGADLARWQPPVEDPVMIDYGRYRVAKTGPWGQGPVMLQQLALLQAAGIADVEPGSADWVHLITEASKLAYADREAWYGDPDFTDVPLDDLLSPEYAKQRATLLGDTSSPDLRPGSPGGREPTLPRYPGDHEADPAAGSGEPTLRGDTCHLDVVDANGMMISATPSGGWLQSSPVIPGLGFCLGTRGQMFWLQDGLPNSLRPGARPRTTLTPSYAFRDGDPWLAFGTPGGDFQDQWSLHFLLDLIHRGMNLQQAIDAPDFHTLAVPNSFYPRDIHPRHLVIEDRFGPDVITELRRRGHLVEVGDGWSLGRISAVARDGGWLKAGANPRGAQGYAVGR